MKIEPDTTYPSFEALQVAAAKLVAEGWTSLPADNPRNLIVGYSVFRTLLDGVPETPEDAGRVGERTEESVWLCWKPFGTVEPVVRTVTRDDNIRKLLEALPKKLFKADNPMARQVGFMSFDGEPRPTLTLIPLTFMKLAYRPLTVHGLPFMEWHKTIPDMRTVCLAK